MSELMQTTIEVVHKPSGDTFTFAIPSLHDEFRVSARVKKIRKAIDPDWDGYEQGLDGYALMGMNACATFEVLLRASSAKWVYSGGIDGKPVVDSSKFPIDRNDEVRQVGVDFQTAVQTFRAGGDTDKQAPDTEAVAGQQDTA